MKEEEERGRVKEEGERAENTKEEGGEKIRIIVGGKGRKERERKRGEGIRR